jgi:hypothetical protein
MWIIYGMVFQQGWVTQIGGSGEEGTSVEEAMGVATLDMQVKFTAKVIILKNIMIIVLLNCQTF